MEMFHVSGQNYVSLLYSFPWRRRLPICYNSPGIIINGALTFLPSQSAFAAAAVKHWPAPVNTTSAAAGGMDEEKEKRTVDDSINRFSAGHGAVHKFGFSPAKEAASLPLQLLGWASSWPGRSVGGWTRNEESIPRNESKEKLRARRRYQTR